MEADMKWVSVNDEMPEKYTPVLVVTDEGDVRIGSWYGYMWVCQSYICATYHKAITHWARLPEPPKESN